MKDNQGHREEGEKIGNRRHTRHNNRGLSYRPSLPPCQRSGPTALAFGSRCGGARSTSRHPPAWSFVAALRGPSTSGFTSWEPMRGWLSMVHGHLSPIVTQSPILADAESFLYFGREMGNLLSPTQEGCRRLLRRVRRRLPGSTLWVFGDVGSPVNPNCYMSSLGTRFAHVDGDTSVQPL